MIVVKNNCEETKDILNSSEESNPFKIKNIKGGIGITFVIKNDGDDDISDITLYIRAEGSFIKIRSPNLIQISKLNAGDSTKIFIKVFGFGFGEPIDYSRIIITAYAPSIITIERIIIASVFGPFVNIVAVFINDEGSYEGYTLFSPELTTDTYLINNRGEIVKRWKSKYLQSISFCLLKNGSLIRSCLSKINPNFAFGGGTGRVEMFDWNGTLIWEFEYSNNQHCLHHDLEPLPNGNILMIAWEVKTYAEAVAAGRHPLTVPAGVIWPCYIIEVDPIFPKGGNIVWEWHVWDHLIQDHNPTKDNYGVVADHPELIDINFGAITGIIDWNHLNSLDYNEEFDQILISSHVQNEIWIIDHSTTTEEAAGHTGGRYGKGGDLLYRWGNSQVYRAGNASDQKFFGQHDARWIKSGCLGGGNILVFNNGFLRPESFYSSVDEIKPPVDSNGNYYLESGSVFGPEEPVWSYTAEDPSDFYAWCISGAQRLPNGNTLICHGPRGIFFEVTPEKEVVWEYNNLFPDLINTYVTYIYRYPLDYPGLGDFTNKPVNRVIETKHVLTSNHVNHVIFNLFIKAIINEQNDEF